jgi:hypothetical protein
LTKLRNFHENTINNSFNSWIEEFDEIFCGKLFELLQLAPFSTWLKLINFTKPKFMDFYEKVNIFANICKKKEFKPKIPTIDALLASLYLYKAASIHKQLCLTMNYLSAIIMNGLKQIYSVLNKAGRFSPPSITKNDKPDREKNHEYLANGSFDFNRTKKFRISAKNYTRKEPKINDSDQGWDTRIRQENRTTKEDRRVQPRKGQKEHYNNGDENVRQESQSNVWMSRLRPRTKSTILENSTEKHKGKLNSK